MQDECDDKKKEMRRDKESVDRASHRIDGGPSEGDEELDPLVAYSQAFWDVDDDDEPADEPRAHVCWRQRAMRAAKWMPEALQAALARLLKQPIPIDARPRPTEAEWAAASESALGPLDPTSRGLPATPRRLFKTPASPRPATAQLAPTSPPPQSLPSAASAATRGQPTASGAGAPTDGSIARMGFAGIALGKARAGGKPAEGAPPRRFALDAPANEEERGPDA